MGFFSSIAKPFEKAWGAISGKDATEKAVAASEAASERAAQVQLQMFREAQKERAPWTAAGAGALETLQQRIAAGPGEYTESPGYQRRLREGQQALMAQTGGYRSGALDKALMEYGQEFAESDYDRFLNRYYQSLQPLQSLAGLGFTSAQGGAGATQQAGANLANIYQGAGQQRASAYMNQANVISNLIGQGVGAGAMMYGMR